ncbi:DMT family transporter [Desulfitibacter alkalitolerans]|uniref:DMT family transporter n=1 Tax=Desulfitibacter alkalitolerans TaxID=264641 RepID=UPI000486F4B9|nr:DMT family transporter [Desulfitibacter alkalitolerans]
MDFSKKWIIYILLLLATISWGASFVAGRYAVGELHPLVAASSRFILAFLVLLPILILKEGRNILVSLRDLPLLFAAGLTGIVIYNICFFTGLKYTYALNGSLIVAAGPVFTALLSSWILKEEVTIRHWLGVLLSIAGVLFIISSGSIEVLLKLNFNPGDILITFAIFNWSIYTIVGKFTGKKFSSLLTITYACGIGAIILTLLAIPHYRVLEVNEISGGTIFSIIFLAVAASAMAFVFWYHGVKYLNASKVAVFQNVVPLAAAVFSILILGEQLKYFHLAGGLLIFLGVYTANRKKSEVLDKPANVRLKESG